jgi:hypothetical protein
MATSAQLSDNRELMFQRPQEETLHIIFTIAHQSGTPSVIPAKLNAVPRPSLWESNRVHPRLIKS